MLLMLSFSSMAQEAGKIRVGIDLAGVTDFKILYGVRSISIEPKYNISENLSIGVNLKYGIAGSFYQFSNEFSNLNRSYIISTNFDNADLSLLGTVDYYFKRKNGKQLITPYIGVGLGLYTNSHFTVDEVISPYAVTAVRKFTNEDQFGGMIRGGFEVGKFRMGVQYQFVPNTKYDFLEGNIVAKNSYFGFNLGFFIGGGKWNKVNADIN